METGWGQQNKAGWEQLLMSQAQRQAADFNSSMFSRALSSDIKRNVGAVVSGFAAPGEALRGNLGYSATDPRMMDAAANMAGVVSLGGGAMPRPANSLGTASRESFDQLLAQAKQRLASREAMTEKLASSGRTSIKMTGKAGAALVGPDMSKPGGYRVTYFDPEGIPNGHVETTSYADAIKRALMDGFSEQQAQ